MAAIPYGDFTTQGDWSDDTKRKALAEFEELRRVLGLEPSQVVSIPGNHDIVGIREGVPTTLRRSRRQSDGYQHETGFRTFQDELTGRDWKLPLNYVRGSLCRDGRPRYLRRQLVRIVATKWTEYDMSVSMASISSDL